MMWQSSPCYHLWSHCQVLQHNLCTSLFPYLYLMKINVKIVSLTFPAEAAEAALPLLPCFLEEAQLLTLSLTQTWHFGTLFLLKQPVDVVSCRSQTTASFNPAHFPIESWSHFPWDSKETRGWSKYQGAKSNCASEISGLYQWVSWASSWKTQRKQKVCRAAVGEPQLSPHWPVVSHHRNPGLPVWCLHIWRVRWRLFL